MAGMGHDLFLFVRVHDVQADRNHKDAKISILDLHQSDWLLPLWRPRPVPMPFSTMDARIRFLSPTFTRAVAAIAILCAFTLLGSAAQRKKKKEEETQTLQIPKELPNAVVGETRRLTFHVTPLSANGLLSQQIRDALKALARDTGSDT